MDVHMRVQGIGRGSESTLQAVAVSGGSRGAGVAALAKLAAICAGTAGTAAVCAATGILPAPSLITDRDDKPPAKARAIPKKEEPRPAPMAFVRSDDLPGAEPPANESQQPSPDPVTAPAPVEPVVEDPVAQAPAPAPAPTPTETEFTPEAAGTPAPASTPPPQPASSQVPVSNGGGEFAP